MRYSRRTALLPRFANGAAFYLHHASKVIGRQAEVVNFTRLTGRNLIIEQSYSLLYKIFFFRLPGFLPYLLNILRILFNF
jgi:hypothetical protein